MTNLNETLPDNLKSLISKLSTQQAIPLGSMSDLPFVALKLGKDYEHMIGNSTISCELKPTILNIDYGEEAAGICFVQVRLNEDDNLIYTATYDLNNAKHYADAHALLNMKKFGLFICGEKVHDFIAFDNTFEADFDPQKVLEYAKDEASDCSGDLFLEISYGLRSQASSAKDLWNYFDHIAPFEKQWYGRMQINKEQSKA